MAERRGNKKAVEMLVDLASYVSVVNANKTDAERLEVLTNLEGSMEEHLNLDFGSAQKAYERKYTTGVASVQGAEKLTEPHLKSKKILGQFPSHAYTTKEID